MKKNLTHTHSQYKGFTLLEVMVALLIIALTLFALLRVMAIQANHQHYLEEKTYAQWVALNIADEIQLGLIALPAQLDVLDGQTQLMNKTWFWTAQFKASADQSALQTTIDIRSAKNRPAIIQILAYLTPPAPEGPSP